MTQSWTAAEDALLGTMPDRIVAMKTGKSLESVTKRRRKLKVQPWNALARSGPSATGNSDRVFPGSKSNLIAPA